MKTASSFTKSIRSHLTAAFVVVLALTVGVGSWAAFTEISGAVVAPGTLVVESRIKAIQHKEGGIVRDIRVRDGDYVQAGDLLLVLDDTVTRAEVASLTQQLESLHAKKLRLKAERDGLSDLAVPASESSATETARSHHEEHQAHLMDARRQSREGRKDQLIDQIGQIHKKIEGFEAQLVAKVEEIELVEKELVDLEHLLKQQLVQQSRVTALQRNRAQLVGQHGGLTAAIAEANEAISERRVQEIRIDEDFRAETLELLDQVRTEIARLEERKVDAEDRLTRNELRAPKSGYVHALGMHTVGGVIGAGQTVMQIVPGADLLVVEAPVSPVSIDQLAPGQKATLRFPNFNQRTTPTLTASVKFISPDLVFDETTGQGFYNLRLEIDSDEYAKFGDKPLLPGMPVEVFIKTEDRNVLSYLVKPMTDQIAHALRER
ncbi:HlyD family type I secretion periplasmic adaptor subunit [Flavimaribacter sediminis]|nr:HlyD family type I secretion periplasmic adaptor subunit [Flavimaribacter sediminis]